MAVAAKVDDVQSRFGLLGPVHQVDWSLAEPPASNLHITITITITITINTERERPYNPLHTPVKIQVNRNPTGYTIDRFPNPLWNLTA